MSQSNNNFDDKLNQLYKKHKSDNQLSSQEKKQLIAKINKDKYLKKLDWINTFQISLASVALFTLFGLLFNQRDYQNNIEDTVYNPENAIIEVHYLENNTYHKEIKPTEQKTKSQIALQQASEKLDRSQSNLKNKKQFKGILINKADNWYIESCNKEVLVQINASLINQLKRNNALDNNIIQGDLLAFKHNSNGEIIAMIKSDNLLQCQG